MMNKIPPHPISRKNTAALFMDSLDMSRLDSRPTTIEAAIDKGAMEVDVNVPATVQRAVDALSALSAMLAESVELPDVDLQ